MNLKLRVTTCLSLQ